MNVKEYKIVKIHTNGCDLYLSRDPTGTQITAVTLEELETIIKERNVDDKCWKDYRKGIRTT